MSLPDLNTKTLAPIKHSERVEFGDEGWLAAAREFLEPRVAELAGELAGQRLAIQETYTDAPEHLAQSGNMLHIHYVFDDDTLNLGHGPVDEPNLQMQADYNLGHIVNATVYEAVPGRQARVMRELKHRHGDVFSITTNGRPPKIFGQLFAGIHDHLARRIVSNPDLDHRARHLGVESNLEELSDSGYTIIEHAISDDFAHELAADLRRLIEENDNRRKVARRRRRHVDHPAAKPELARIGPQARVVELGVQRWRRWLPRNQRDHGGGCPTPVWRWGNASHGPREQQCRFSRRRWLQQRWLR